MKFSREWAMPSAETFSIAPIERLLRWYLKDCKVIVDPFARNSRFGTLRNDLSPDTEAEHHLDAIEFCERLVSTGVRADAVLFDPPYSAHQIVTTYQGVGEKEQNGHQARILKDLLDRMLRDGGLALCFGWNSNGFGADRLYALDELLLVAHGGGHNDTIVTVERKMQGDLFGSG